MAPGCNSGTVLQICQLFHWGVLAQRADNDSLLLHRKDAGFERSLTVHRRFSFCSRNREARLGHECMSDRIRIFKHQAVPGGGSFEVRFADGRESQYFYWDDIPARRLRPDLMDRETVLEKAEALARAASLGTAGH